MEDILKQFLEDGGENLGKQPFDFFPISNEASEGTGILPFFYLKWAATHGLLLNNNELTIVTTIKDTLASKLKKIRVILGDQLLPSHFTPEGNAFTQCYYRPGWKYFYLTDFGKTFDEYDDLDDVTDTESNYGKIRAVLEDRFLKWQPKS
mgnify:CR=1 FL=1